MKPNLLVIGASEFAAEARVLAADLVGDNFVYCATPACEEMTDTPDGVRHLPLRNGSLPGFGALAGVHVLGPATLLAQVSNAYPHAPIYRSDRSLMDEVAPVQRPVPHESIAA